MANLQKMFDMQEALQKSLGYDIKSMTTKERTEYIKEFSIHLNQETNEMLYELPFFKPWKDYSGMALEEIAAAQDKARKEYVDMWHFMLNLGLALDFTEQDLFDAYYEKNAENYKRQEEGYTHDVSYRKTPLSAMTAEAFTNTLKNASAMTMAECQRLVSYLVQKESLETAIEAYRTNGMKGLVPFLNELDPSEDDICVREFKVRLVVETHLDSIQVSNFIKYLSQTKQLGYAIDMYTSAGLAGIMDLIGRARLCQI